VKAYEVTANVAGIEILGIRFGFSSRDLEEMMERRNRYCVLGIPGAFWQLLSDALF